MNDNRLRWTDIGLPYMLGWHKEVDLQESYTALPKGRVVWGDTLDYEIQTGPTYYEDIV